MLGRPSQSQQERTCKGPLTINHTDEDEDNENDEIEDSGAIIVFMKLLETCC